MEVNKKVFIPHGYPSQPDSLLKIVALPQKGKNFDVPCLKNLHNSLYVSKGMLQKFTSYVNNWKHLSSFLQQQKY